MNIEGARQASGVRGHAPPGKFRNLESLKCRILKFMKCIKDMTFYDLTKHAFL